MAGGSKPRSPQNGAGRASQKRSHPKPKQPKLTSNWAAPQAAANFRSRISRSRSPSPPPSPLFDPMDEFALAAHMREISGGPITASLDTPQPLNVLNTGVHSRTKLLARAQQAKHARERGQEIPASSPGAKSIMVSPSPQPPATVPQAHATIQGEFQPQDMHRTMSMPQNFQYNPQGHMGPQNMPMDGQHYHHIGPIANGLPATAGLGGRNAQFRSSPQHMASYQGQFGGVGPNGGAGIGFNTIPGMNFGPPFGYTPQAGMPPPSMPQQMYHQGGPLNYAPTGGFAPMMPPNMPFHPQMNAGQVTNPVSNSQYRHGPSRTQRPVSRMTNIDPQLFDETTFVDMQPIDQQAAMAFNFSRPPTRNGAIATPQPNHVQQFMAQQARNGAHFAPGVNLPSNLATQGTGNWPIPAATQPNPTRQSMAQQGQVRPTSTPQVSHSGNLMAQETQNGPTATSQPNNILQSIARNGAAATSRVNHPANSEIQGARIGTSLQTNPSGSPAAHEAHKKVIVTFTEPVFDKPFTFPTSSEGWNTVITEDMMRELQEKGKNSPSLADLGFRVLNGKFELHFVRPVFRQGWDFWKGNPQASGIPNNEARFSPPAAQMDLDPPASSEQSGVIESSQNPSSSGPTRQATQPATERQAPVTGPTQGKPNQNPKTPPMKGPDSLANHVTPSISPLTLASSPDASISVQRPALGAGRTTGLATQKMPNLSKQPLESHSQTSHNRPTGKRAAPTAKQEVSPSKRRKPSAESSSITSGPAGEFPTITKGGFDGRLEFASPSYPSAVPEEFAEKVAGLPTPQPTQNPPSGHYKSRRESQFSAPSQSFDPRPSQAIKDSELFNSPQRQYSSRVRESMKQQLANVQDSGLAKPTNEGRSTVGACSDVPTLPQIHHHHLPDGLPAPEQTQQQEQSQRSANAENIQQQQEYRHPSDLLDGGVADTELQQQEDYGFDSFVNDNSDLTGILAMDNDPSFDPVPTAPHIDDDSPEQDPNTGSSSDSNPAPSPHTPAQAAVDAQAESERLAYEQGPIGLGPYGDDNWGDIQYDGPWEQATNAVLDDDPFSLENIFATGGDYSDIVDVGGGNDPAKPQGLMAEFGKFIH